MADETKDESGHFSFPETEEAVLAKWRKNSTFLNSVKRNENLEHYTFYDGPPFATGLPHYGHLLAGTIKDVVTRFAAMDGHFVQRRFGWDTHGLPVEFEIDKLLGIKGPSDVYKMGVKSYNDKCREIVMRYAGEWRTTVERVGRWIDFDNDYKTLYVTFMESVWWVFAQLVKKDLVYRGVKVMPYSTGCSTPLSNFEAGQNYKDVADPAVFVAFPLADNPNRRLVAWTTTPWTLPSNLALSVHPDMQYVVIKDPQHGHELVLLESALKRLWKKPNVKDIVEKFPGSKLKGLKYTPPFEYFKHLDQGQLFRVLTATFVTDDAGTGVVHQAPYFGEIDYATCIEHGVITKEQKMVCPVDEKGLFTAEVTDFAGQYVKDADKNIIADLKKRGILVKAEQITHSYPFCWRSETPLLYKAVPSWFIKVETLVPQLLKNNAQTRWVPEHVREKRFGNWLRDARDWAVSRNRFWGTPINLWVSDDYEELACPESVAELKEMAGYTGEINDIHRHWIDDITIKSKKTGKTLRRVPEIFDCWFESGSMPYASQHYPFENKDIFEQNFPADFIAEGIDQTRGWFYTLLVLSTALFDKPPFKNLICNGLVLASDGTKMSKSKRNFPDPMKIVHEYGADALRLYLINSPAVRGENLRFREQGVRDIVKDVLLPWHNAYRFYSQCVHFYEHTSGKKFVPHDGDVHNIMDKWIYSFTTSLIKFVREKMADYHLFAVVSPLMKFFEALTNCYIRLNRNRMKSPVDEDRLAALSCLNFVLSNICRLMAPFTPFYCEYLWAKLNNVSEDQDESVHYHQLPPVVPKYIDVKVEKEVAAMRSVIELVRLLRERSGISVRYPVSEIVIVHHSQEWLDNVRVLESFLQSECNVKDIKYTTDRKKHGVSLKANIDFKSLGARLQKEQKPVADYLKNKVTQDELETFMDTKTMTVAGHAIGPEDLSVVYTYDPTTNEDPGEWVVESDAEVVVQLNSALNNELLKEGTIRELINRVMQLRKSHGLFHTQHASASLANIDESLRAVLESSQTTIEQATNTALKLVAAGQSLENPTNFKIRDASFDVVLQFEKLAV